MLRLSAGVIALLALAACTSPGGDAGTDDASGGSSGLAASTSDGSTSTHDSAATESPQTDSGASGATGDDSTSAAATEDTTSGGAPGYQPFFAIDCDEGELETRADGPDALASVVGGDAPKVTYTDEQAVDDVGQSCRSTGEATENSFGGRYLDTPTGIGEGDDVWMRHALFFPDGFCFGHGTTSGDGWGSTKWMRMEFDNGGPGPGDRLTLQLTNFAAEGCNDDTEVFGATREYAGTANLRAPDPTPITTGEWHMVQWQVHLATDDTGFVRFWVDDTYQGQVDGITLGAPDRTVAFVMYGDYWNGSPYEDVTWYLDEVIMTTEPPDTLDAGGLPYIAPSARVNDWD